MRKATRWTAWLGSALLALLLAACGSAPAPTQDTTGTLGGGSPQSAAQQATPQKFKHSMGEIEVPSQPKRVIGLYMEDYLAALGVKPVTQTVIGNFSLKYLASQIGDLPKLDTSAVNFEAALQAQPDLILLAFPSYASEGKYDKYAKIAPTYVFGDGEFDDWRATLRKVGQLTGKTKEADSVLQQYEAKAADAKAKLQKALGDQTVALVRIRSNKEIRLYGGPLGYVGNVMYTDLGLKPPAIVSKLAWGSGVGQANISQEVLPQLDADHLFFTYDDGGKELAAEILKSPLWQALPAVKNGRVHEVSLDHWMTSGPIAYEKKLDDIVKALMK